eukprot:scaffold170030_cov28-Tisochrysis_lutea.AAC.2
MMNIFSRRALGTERSLLKSTSNSSAAATHLRISLGFRLEESNMASMSVATRVERLADRVEEGELGGADVAAIHKHAAEITPPFEVAEEERVFVLVRALEGLDEVLAVKVGELAALEAALKRCAHCVHIRLDHRLVAVSELLLDHLRHKNAGVHAKVDKFKCTHGNRGLVSDVDLWILLVGRRLLKRLESLLAKVHHLGLRLIGEQLLCHLIGEHEPLTKLDETLPVLVGYLAVGLEDLAHRLAVGGRAEFFVHREDLTDGEAEELAQLVELGRLVL